MNISTVCNKCGTESIQNSKAYSNLIKRYEAIANIKELSIHNCKKCGEQLHYPSQLHTVFDGHTCCKCLGHAYKECFNPWQRKKVTYEQYKGAERIPPEEECTEGCLTYSKHCEYNHC